MSKKDLVQELREMAAKEVDCDAIRGVLGGSCIFSVCSGCICDALDVIANRIEAECLPRPCFEDGEPVQFGDEFECGRVGTVDTIAFSRDGTVQVKGLDKKSFQVNSDYEEGQAVKRPKDPDTVEKVAADMADCMAASHGTGYAPTAQMVDGFCKRLKALGVKLDD